jgi:protein involved in polysaccharide export with SLBB domain
MTHPRPFLTLLVILVACLSACKSAPDKQMLQYMNTQGFGKRYVGNAEEENYVAIGDSVSVTDSYNDELSVTKQVDIDGTVLLPEIGAVTVAGYTRTELDIKVQITTGGKKYFIYGEINAPGEQPFPGDLTLFEAVMRSGPNKDTANLGRIKVIRADPRDPKVYEINIGDMFEYGDSSFNWQVRELDIIFVPPTMMAQLGYFLDSLLFPVKFVLNGIGGAIFALNQWRFYSNGVVQ